MDDNIDEVCASLQSPKPTAFTIDFDAGKTVDTQRHKSLVAKYQRRHHRGQSLSQIEDMTTTASMVPKKPQSANLPRKALSMQNADEKSDQTKHIRLLRDALTLPLKNMTQSCTLPSIDSPSIEDISTPELEALRPPTPQILLTPDNDRAVYDASSDKTDAVSDAGTYTLDADAYSEEQKARMSIDREFKIETVSDMKKAHDYVQSLSITNKLSPTQHFSINSDEYSKTIKKILFPSTTKAKPVEDHGCVISVTSSGAFRSRADRTHARRMSLTKSDIHVEAYADNKHVSTQIQRPSCNLSASLVYVSEHNGTKVLNLPPSGKATPTKIPSPIHNARPRSRSSTNSLNVDLSDSSSMETESYLKSTEKLLNTLQQRLSLDSDAESEDDGTTELLLNNDARKILKNASHLRHNSLDDKFLMISNKLEHFHNKTMFIDQTNVLNQYRGQHKIQNSPTSSPIRRSSSFSANNQIKDKCSNAIANNIRQQQHLARVNRNGSIQRSASTAAVRSTALCRIDRSQYGDTESSSEEDMLQNSAKKKDITTTRYNRAFSLRRARLDGGEATSPKCPNTPEMRRKFQPERAISVDRKPTEIQSRYMQNLTRMRPPAQSKTNESIKCSSNMGNTATKPTPKAQVFARTDAGRFSTRTKKPAMTNSQKTIRRDVNLGHKKPGGPRSNSSLSSKEVEFQNWKRRKSYDPMKAAAEGKRKAELARKQNVNNTMTQSYHESNQECDSSPSHSSSVHRSQSFHGTAALEQYLTTDDDDVDDDDDELTLSADEGFSPPTPSPCEMSAARTNLRYAANIHHR